LIGLRAVVIRFALIWLCWIAFASPVFADIWGFVDEKGVGHFSATKVDERYELFSKELLASQAPASQLGSDPNSRCAQQLGSDPNCLPHTLAGNRLSPKLAAFFESSSTLNPDTRRLLPVRWSELDLAQTHVQMTKLMGKGEAASRRELMEIHGDGIEIDV
jgi:hypothetical protein